MVFLRERPRFTCRVKQSAMVWESNLVNFREDAFFGREFKSNLSAYGYVAQDGFIVTKGSQMSASERASCRDWVKNQRKALMEDGKVVDYTFSEDVLFKSPSAAAACIVGGESNGLIMWKNDSGKKLKDLQ